jgi:nitroreductase
MALSMSDLGTMNQNPPDSDPTTNGIDLASVDRVLETTRSVRRHIDFDRPIEPEVIERCIEIATQAPTGVDAENWRFLVVTSPEKKAELAELYRRAYLTLIEARGIPLKPTHRALMDRLPDMPAMILVCAEGRIAGNTESMQVGFLGSILPAAWSLMLALRARGLGSTWTSLLVFHAEEVARILDIPKGITQTVMLPVGYMSGAVLKPAKRKPPHEVTYWDRWGERRSDRPEV